MRKTKLSQVSVFIILGIMIIFSALIVYYIKERSVDVPVEPGLPSDSIDQYVENCILQTANEAIVMLGQQGGYINVSEETRRIAELSPERSNALSLSRNLAIPYWFYQDSSGIDLTERPVLEKSYDDDGSVEDQLETWIAANIGRCLDDFEPFMEEYTEIKKAGEQKADIIIADEDVHITLIMPLELRKNNNVITKKEFSASVPVRLRKAYFLATDILTHELNTLFMERNTRDLIFIYSRVDRDYLPPMSGGLEFLPCGDRVLWLQQDVKEDFRAMLSNNMPYLKIANTDFEPIKITRDMEPDSSRREQVQAVYDNMIKTVSDSAYPNMKVDISYYPEFPLELDLGDDELLGPHSYEINMIFRRLCMFQYRSYYNVRYPVLVTITDEGSDIDKQPFIFQFPMDVVLRDNYPRVKLSSIKEVYHREEEYKESLCSTENRLSSEVELNFIDNSSNPVGGVDLYFQCGPEHYYSFDDEGMLTNMTRFSGKCFIGKSEGSTFRGRLPLCIGGGAVTPYKEGYLEKKVLLGDVLEDSEIKRSISLDKIRTLDVNFEKLFVGSGSGSGSTGVVLDENEDVISCASSMEPKKLKSNEKVILRMKKLDPENGRLPYDPFIYYQPGIGGTEFSRLSISPGRYEVDLMLLRSEGYEGEMTIHKGAEVYDADGDDILVPDEDIPLPQSFTGGAFYELTITEDDLSGKHNVTFYLFDEGAPETLSQIGRPLEHREGCSALNMEWIRPVFG